jgi:hypothetical protein
MTYSLYQHIAYAAVFLKLSPRARYQWLMPVFLTIWEAEIGWTGFKASPGK